MGQSISTSDTIVSAEGNFELGFFSKNSTEYFVGAWFKKIPGNKIVWVANRDNEFTGSSAILTIYKDGNLVIMQDELLFFMTNISSKSNSTSTHAMLLDSGNFILLNDLTLEILWQSFKYPTNTLLPEMNIGVGSVSGDPWSLRSWTSPNDPRTGFFSLEVVENFGSWLLVIKRNSVTYWIGDQSSNFTLGNFKRGNDVWFNLRMTLSITWQGEYGSLLELEVSGELNQLSWSDNDKQWISIQSSKCGTRALCGNFGVCNPQAMIPCDCVPGFEPNDPSSWMKGKTSAGCVRKKPLLCSNTSSDGSTDGFILIKAVDFPPNDSLILNTPNALICRTTCSGNCSCLAYAYNSQSQCLLWHDHVLDLKNISVDVGYADNQRPSFFLKLAASEIKNELNTGNNLGHKSNSSKKLSKIGIFVAVAAMLILGLFVYFYYKWKKLRGSGEDLLQFDVGMGMKVESSDHNEADKIEKVDKREVKLPFFSFTSVSAATDNFSAENKLGEGGFGPVYKGKLLNGDEVAVKRLSKRSGQGWDELKNEAMLIAKLQHNNLVRLLGCCVERDEKMLIYELMPNKSLDFILFDASKSMMLDWETRVRIIEGIAQGLLYLHQYSRLRIIHRDLKASNILLDIKMNPKISDFGMARMFGGNEVEANTNRIVGTYGYMSPEYALEGLFSVKSDVFSFGVLFLEIMTGKKNTGFYNMNSLNLLAYAWGLWTTGRAIEMMDPVLKYASNKQNMMIRYVNIAFLCVQEYPADRPVMSDVVSMLSNENVVLPCPKPPAFLYARGTKNSSSVGSSTGNVSLNIMTASVIEAR
ncbi:hypothetical protein TanjilG_29889 [Lupinus angustifolius]|uniref:Receptor-like serine/threonine-protein kinase n=2 Tax=Lupinus angustifolius TaxID=3871 RepID=A0A4P1RA61_LUPAN|nr:hypothetical protein TanjilG_29889 [Lupinus angustifolius]